MENVIEWLTTHHDGWVRPIYVLTPPLIVLVVGLLSWPARRLLRWRRNRRNLKRLTLGGWADIFKMTMPCMPRQNFVFTDANGGGKWVDAPKQPEKRADSFPNIPWAEYPLQNRVITGGGSLSGIGPEFAGIKYATFAEFRRGECHDSPADSSPDLPPYGGSKPSEDARPVTRKELDAEIRNREDNFDLATYQTGKLEECINARLAALEAAPAKAPPCTHPMVGQVWPSPYGGYWRVIAVDGEGEASHVAWVWCDKKGVADKGGGVEPWGQWVKDMAGKKPLEAKREKQ